jgi:predicted metal-dependent hydrolase
LTAEWFGRKTHLFAVAAPLQYLAHYPAHLRESVRGLIASGRLGEVIHQRYPNTHAIQSNSALYDYTMKRKREHMVSSPPLSKVCFCEKIATFKNALGLHTQTSRVHGTRLESKREIRIASVFKQAPPEFLEQIVVHELAHLRHAEHDKAFYRLCCHMQPDYHQIEFDMRMWLTWLDLRKQGEHDLGGE